MAVHVTIVTLDIVNVGQLQVGVVMTVDTGLHTAAATIPAGISPAAVFPQ